MFTMHKVYCRAQASQEQRNDLRTDKRRKMMADLQQREQQSQSQRSEEQEAHHQLQREIARLRKKAAEQQAAKMAHNEAAFDGSHPPAQEPPSRTGMDEKLARTVKVSWSPFDDYDVARVTALLSTVGPVEEVVLRDAKKRKGTALVVMRSESDAAAAFGHVLGHPTNPLLIKPVQHVRYLQLVSGFATKYVVEGVMYGACRRGVLSMVGTLHNGVLSRCLAFSRHHSPHLKKAPARQLEAFLASVRRSLHLLLV
jgi:hypothetical protein